MSNQIKITTFVLMLSIPFWSGCTSQTESAEIYGSSVKSNTGKMNESEKDGPGKRNDVHISVSMTNSQLVIREPVIMDFKVTNELNQAIQLDLGENRKESFVFTLVLPGGQEIKLRQLKRGGFSRTGRVLIEPNSSYSQKVVLNEWTDFLLPGKYVLKVHLANDIKTTDGELLAVRPTSTTEFNVEGENAERLKIVSEELVKKIFESNSYQEAADAALTLSYVKDPVAIPFLQKALTSNKMVESVIINSLRESSGKVSVEVLVGAINKKPDSEMADYARSALDWIGHHSSDVEVKEMVRQALSEKKRN